MRRMVGLIALVASLASPLAAEEGPIDLKAGVGKEIVEANCGACHSLDYIKMNSPFLGAKVWDAEVTKMIKYYGAPIDDGDAKKIIEYLATNYGG